MQKPHLFNTEPCRLHGDGHSEVLLHLLLGLVDGHVNTVKAGMCAGKDLHVAVAV